IFCNSSLSQTGWQLQSNGVPPDKDLYAIKALNTLNVWVCGADGVILRTTDGGDLWASANPPSGGVPTTEQLLAVEANTTQQAWVGSASGKIYKTTDGGVSWTLVFDSPTTSGSIAMVKRVLLGRVFAIGDAPTGSSPLAVLYSTDFGSTWANVNTGLIGGTVPPGAADFSNLNTGWLWSAQHGLQQSTDAGISWSSVPVTGLDTARGVAFGSTAEGYLVASQGRVWQTTDAGASWMMTMTPTSVSLNKVVFANLSPYRFALGGLGTIMVSTNTGVTWEMQTSGVTTGLNGGSFASATVAWIVGDQGTILKTSSAGVLPPTASWSAQSHSVPSDFIFRLVRASSGSACTIFGTNKTGSVLLATTTDAGQMWSYVSTDPGLTGSSVLSYDIVSQDVAFFGTDDGRLFRTMDAGTTWSTVFQSPDVQNIQYVKFFNGSDGIAVGDAASSGVPLAVLGSTDGGSTWVSQSSSFLGANTFPEVVGFYSRLVGLLVELPADEYQFTTDGGQSWSQYTEHPSVVYHHFLSDQNLLGIGIESPRILNAIYKSTDAGMSWTFKANDGAQVEFDNFSSVGSYIWALNSAAKPYTGYRKMNFSSDEGETWSVQDLPTTETLAGVSFASSDTGWAITDGTILFTTSGGITSAGDNPASAIPAEYHLYQNYPNPFNPRTSIRFTLPERVQTTLNVYDVLGREVATLINGVRDPGSYDVIWDATSAASGLYFYRLNAGSHVDIKKMVLLK
ncbi:MAG: YCF48-related protein, partial [Ignavibacteria bacterium]|nr:YCF48-related protein [Ignavibacteria bacterium]